MLKGGEKLKKGIRILLSLCFVMCCVSLGCGLSKSNAAAGTVTSYEKITWGISTGRYGVNGIHAYCAEYSKSWPPVGATIESISLTENEIIRKALYYGYNGPKNKLGTDARAHVLTAIAISDANIGERETGASSKYDEFYWDLVNNPSKYPNPPSNFKAYIAVTSSTSQQDLAFYQIEKNGYVKILKRSKQEEITQGNSCYSLAGAQYAIYSSSQLLESSRVGTLVTNEDGESNSLELAPGTYYAKEIAAPKGYALSDEVTKFTVSSEKTEVLQLTEKPQTNPVDLLIQKVDEETGNAKPQGNASLKGAQFTMKFYAGLWEKDTDPATLGQKPTRTWVFETDENAQVHYEESYKISGDALYFALPLGTITIQETKAPEGYFRNDTMFVRQIISQGYEENLSSYKVPVVAERSIQVEIFKFQTETTIPIPGTVFELTKANESKERFTTDESGKIILKGLAYGKYELREVTVMDGYLQSDEVFSFVVDEETQENICITVYNNPAPYELVVHKTDDYGNLLSGAEFTLYEDELCTQEVQKACTDENGILQMEGLIAYKNYYLKETKAPAGYQLEELVYEVYAQSIPAKDEFRFYINKEAQTSVTGTWDKKMGHVEMNNQIAYTLPKTGVATPYWLTLAGLALCGISICSKNNMKKDRKKEKKE